MDALQFVVQLQDAVSGPANSAAAALAGIGSAAQRTGAAERGAATAARQMGAAEAAAAGQARALASAQDHVASRSERAAKSMKGLGKVLEFAGVPFASKLNQGAEILEQVGPAGLAAGAAVGTIAIAALAAVAGLGAFVGLSVAIFKIADKSNAIGKAWDGLKSKAARIFERVDVSPIAASLDKFSSLFDANTASGEALAHVIGKVWSAVAELTGQLIDLARPFFEGIVIGALQAYVAFLQIKNSGVGEYFKSLADVLTPSSEQLKSAGQAAGYLAAILLGGLAVAVTSAAAVIRFWVAAASGMAGLIQSIAGFLGSILTPADAVSDSLVGMADAGTSGLSGLVSSAASIASDFVSGLVTGIANGVGRVVDAAKSLGASAAGAVKAALGIASPSRVMMSFGGYTAEGLALGMDAGRGDVATSARQLAAIPAAEAAAPVGAGGRTEATSSRSMTVGGVTINITGVAGAEQILDRLPSALADAFEVIAESMGAPINA